MKLQNRVDPWLARFDALDRQVETLRDEVVTSTGELSVEPQNARNLEQLALVFALTERLHLVRDEMDRILNASISTQAKEERLDELLEEGTLVVEPHASAARELLGRPLEHSREFERSEVLDDLEELLDELAR